jgi:secreted PhoX family phosphatase
MDRTVPGRAQARELAEDVGRNASANPTMGEVIATRFGRRDVLRGALAVTAISATMGPLALAAARKARAAAIPGFGFEELAVGVDEKHHVAPGYKAQVLVRWGDPVLPGAPGFDPMAQTAEKQRLQFGYNNDFIGYFPIDGSSEHGLLCENHEYTNEELMFPGVGYAQQEAPPTPAVANQQGAKQAGASAASPAMLPAEQAELFARMTPELVAVELAAHGGSVLEVRKGPAGWEVVKDSPYARRITAETPIELTGPAAGHDRLRTKADATGTRVLGMINNCAGGMTPWGTWLSAEENFNGYFWGDLPEDHPEFRNHERVGLPGNQYNWGAYHDRFDVAKEPNEGNRFGWIVEIDPFDPASTPKKRTALGRFKHEGATTIVNKDGRVVAYTGDDERFDYVYRFVTAGRFDPANRAANLDLLDEGTLSVARYSPDGSLDWLPLVHGQGPLTAENGFQSQADVQIETRRAADLVGATPMDRPEDIEPNPKTGKVYLMLTNNTKRKPEQVDAANPRPDNAFGHIVEMAPPDGDYAADRFAWEILVRCGDPGVADVGATFSSATTQDGWFGMPDNCTVDGEGRLWIATDGNNAEATGRTDGLWALETEGEARGTSRCFFRVPVGAELCGPMFTPDTRTAFVAVQHPGEEDAAGNPGSFEAPPTRWPDFKVGMPPRPSIVVITKEDGGLIGA